MKAVTAALYDEGAVMVIHAVLINCRLMLERSSNIYGQFFQPLCLLELEDSAILRHLNISFLTSDPLLDVNFS